MTYPEFEPGTFGLAVSIANHYTIQVHLKPKELVVKKREFLPNSLFLTTSFYALSVHPKLHKSFLKFKILDRFNHLLKILWIWTASAVGL
jgi:hypothetical protein